MTGTMRHHRTDQPAQATSILPALCWVTLGKLRSLQAMGTLLDHPCAVVRKIKKMITVSTGANLRWQQNTVKEPRPICRCTHGLKGDPWIS